MGLKNIFNINETKGKAVWLFVILLIAAAVVYYFVFIRKSDDTEYITAKVSRGTLVNKVAATGTMQAVTTVQVGSQASGTIFRNLCRF